MKFKKGQSGNANGRPKGATDKKKTQLRDWLDNYLGSNTLKLDEELNKLTGKDYIDSFTKLMEYGIPKLQRQTIEIDTEKIIRTFNFIPASEIVPEKESTNGENK